METIYLTKHTLTDYMATTDHEPSRQHIARAMSALRGAGWNNPSELLFAKTYEGSLFMLGSERHASIMVRSRSGLKGGWHAGCATTAPGFCPGAQVVHELPGIHPKPFGDAIDLWVAMLLAEELAFGWTCKRVFSTDTIRDVLGEDAVQQLQLAMTPTAGAA